ncbi:hypothetical protein ACIA8C_04775 [Nocardia sp. NPDC051321]|uniref:hypothetical protein n=1 Tax=Nocardia sp. NPDC051321 TaxID=3364323 RepID=UPI0037909E06
MLIAAKALAERVEFLQNQDAALTAHIDRAAPPSIPRCARPTVSGPTPPRS